MGLISPATIDRILDAARIEEVVGEFATLKRSGSSFRGLSPFTQEKTPSFYVVPSKGIFKCFSSGKGGSVVTFLMEHEKLTYPDALRWLAKKYSIEIEEEETSPEQEAVRDRRESMFAVNAFALKQFSEWMWNDDQGRAVGLAYFKERGFSEETIRKFELGFHLDGRNSFAKSATSKSAALAKKPSENLNSDFTWTGAIVLLKVPRKSAFFRSLSRPPGFALSVNQAT